MCCTENYCGGAARSLVQCVVLFGMQCCGVVWSVWVLLGVVWCVVLRILVLVRCGFIVQCVVLFGAV